MESLFLLSLIVPCTENAECPFSLRIDYDTDEETDKLLGIEHRMNAKNQAIREAVRRHANHCTPEIHVQHHRFSLGCVKTVEITRRSVDRNIIGATISLLMPLFSLLSRVLGERL